MLTTTGFVNFGIEMDGAVNDSTVTVLPGTAQIGNTLRPWDGTRTQLNRISQFSGAPDATHWQNVLLYLAVDSTATGVGMFMSRSATAATRVALKYPDMTTSAGHPLSLFTFTTANGFDSTLVSFT